MIGGVHTSVAQQTQPRVVLAANRTRNQSRSLRLFNPIKADLLLLWDAAAVLLAGAGCANEMGGASSELLELACLGAGLAPVLLRGQDRPRSAGSWLLHIATRMPILLLLVTAAAALAGAVMPPFWLAAWIVSGAAVVMLGRLVLVAAESACRERIVVIGEGADADLLRAEFSAAAGIELIPFTRGTYDRAHMERVADDLAECSRRGEMDRVVLAMPGDSAEYVRHICRKLKAVRTEVSSFYPLLEAATPPAITQVAGRPLFRLSAAPLRGWGELTKLALDRVFALCILLWITPILAGIAIAIRLDSPGPILFRQKRHGVNGTEFLVFKFRTMTWQGEGAGSGDRQTQRGDKRITRIGAFLRRTSLDEVPQLLNVLNGTMSLVGPRPHPVVMQTQGRLGEEIVAEYTHRQRVKPGITGLAQVNGYRGATDTEEQLRRRIEYDNHYIENWSLLLDLRILVTTPIAVLFQRENAF